MILLVVTATALLLRISLHIVFLIRINFSIIEILNLNAFKLVKK